MAYDIFCVEVVVSLISKFGVQISISRALCSASFIYNDRRTDRFLHYSNIIA